MSASILADPGRADRVWLPRVVGVHAETFRVIRVAAWPAVDLLMRIGLAQIFFMSGLLKVTHWQTALDLAAHEYPVSWLNPVTSAYLGASIELIAPVFLTVGLLTRLAAIPMLILSLVIQFNYRPFDNQLFWAVLLGWYVIQGAGALSLDCLLRRGFADSALPFAAHYARLTRWLGDVVGPYYISALRIYLAAALLYVGWAGSTRGYSPPNNLSLWLPVATAAHYPLLSALVAGVLLLLGLATRYVALLLTLAGTVGAMMDPRLTDEMYVLALLAVWITHGGGPLALDALVERGLRVRFPQLAGKPAFEIDGLPRVVIVGAGFGGMSCAEHLRLARVQVTLVDRGNYHLFQPLLYQVATAAVSPGDIATPIRPLFREAFNTRVLLGTVRGIDKQNQTVLVDDKKLPYDYLVLATGAQHSYFGKDGWAPYAPGLKRIEDATEIRRRLLLAFERAEATDDDTERRALLTFLIVGGGPTGVELAGAIAELARFGMEKEFRLFDPASARVILVQSAPRLLPSFDEKLSAIARRSLEKLGVEILLGSRVDRIDEEGVAVSGTRIAARTVLWAAGVMASPAARWLDAPADSAGRLKVGDDLSVSGLPNVFAIGDTALSTAWNGQPVPGLAPAAKQGGVYVARLIRARIRAQAPPPPFSYRHLGSLATIGRKSAVVDVGPLKLWGAPAWWLWGLVHVGFLVGLRNRVATMTNWFWAYLTWSGGIRLITGSDMSAQWQRPHRQDHT
jgi:NADH dehydrogenase/putative oxidoreductase